MANLHRTLVALLAAPALMVPSAGVFAQPPEGAALPKQICLTNACAEALSGLERRKSLDEAVRAGDSLAVRALGGSPADVVSALQARIEGEADLPEWARNDPAARERYRAREREDFAHLADAAFGAFRFVDQAESLIPFKGGGMPKPGGAAGDIAFLLERRTASGCLEVIVIQDDGRGVPSADMCRR